MRINLTPQQLSGFLQVAATGSFSEAAQMLNISQPALSRTVRNIEEAVGERLFDRDTRNVVLTPAGEALRPIAERLVAEFSDGFSELAQFVAGKRGRITIAALPSVAAVLRFGAVANGVVHGLSLRHDHGPQYMSDAFQSELRFLGIESSPAFVHAPEGNGRAERFIRTLKEKLL
jgi:molybdenum-dependent DNA-binding transcriptional regulator ModE